MIHERSRLYCVALLQQARQICAERRSYSRSWNNLLTIALTALLRNLFHLAQMIQVMTGEHAHDVRDRLLSTLLVHAIVVP